MTCRHGILRRRFGEGRMAATKVACPKERSGVGRESRNRRVDRLKGEERESAGPANAAERVVPIRGFRVRHRSSLSPFELPLILPLRSFYRATRKSSVTGDCLPDLFVIADFLSAAVDFIRSPNTLNSDVQRAVGVEKALRMEPSDRGNRPLTMPTLLRVSFTAEKWRENSAARRVDLAWKIISI